MHALVTRRRRLTWLAAFLFAMALAGCKEHVTRAQCDDLLGRFAELVVKEKLPSAPPEVVRAERDRERKEAAQDDNFKNCATELRVEEYRCAMGAPTAAAFLKCLE